MCVTIVCMSYMYCQHDIIVYKPTVTDYMPFLFEKKTFLLKGNRLPKCDNQLHASNGWKKSSSLTGN